MANKVLIITGMHRSGTSLISHYLGESGLFVGYNLHNSDKSNPLSTYDGHHEDEEFLTFHKRILTAKRMNSFPTNGWRVPIRVGSADRKQAVAMIAARAELTQWAWKDPRTTLFLNFWDQIIDRPQYLFLFRHPLAVVDSLIRRGTDDRIVKQPIIGLRSWQVYNRQILRFWNQHQQRSLLFEIDQLVNEPADAVSQLQTKLGIALTPIPFDKIFSKKAFNFQYSPLVEKLQQQYPREVKRSLKLYQQLQDLVQRAE